MIYLRNNYTGKSYELENEREADLLCEGHNFQYNTLKVAKREGRLSKTGFEIIDEKEYIPTPKSDVKTAVLVGDIHFKYEDKDAINILYQVLKDIGQSLDEYIDLGDSVNNNALSRFADVETDTHTLYEEIKAYEEHMGIVSSLLGPNTKKIIIQDNHYHLRKKKFLAENPGLIGLLPDLSHMFDYESPHAKLYFPFGQKRVGCIHGNSFGDFFTKQHLNQYSKYDVINGHCHTMQQYTSTSGTEYDPARRGYGIPSMCRHMEYLNGTPSRQVCGFGVLTYDEVSNNYGIEYAIVENKRATFRGKVYESTL